MLLNRVCCFVPGICKMCPNPHREPCSEMSVPSAFKSDAFLKVPKYTYTMPSTYPKNPSQIFLRAKRRGSRTHRVRFVFTLPVASGLGVQAAKNARRCIYGAGWSHVESFVRCHSSLSQRNCQSLLEISSYLIEPCRRLSPNPKPKALTPQKKHRKLLSLKPPPRHCEQNVKPSQIGPGSDFSCGWTSSSESSSSSAACLDASRGSGFRGQRITGVYSEIFIYCLGFFRLSLLHKAGSYGFGFCMCCTVRVTVQGLEIEI